MQRALFPLHTVLCPQGRTPLQLFEQRYLNMLSQVSRHGEGFVIVLIKEGSEVGASCQFYDVGTLVQVVDFQGLSNGMLGITVEGLEKVRIGDVSRQPDGLYVGQISLLPPEPPVEVSEEEEDLVALLQSLLRHPLVRALQMAVDERDARSVGWRLVELLPLALADKQFLLTLEDPRYRLEQIRYLLHTLE